MPWSPWPESRDRRKKKVRAEFSRASPRDGPMNKEEEVPINGHNEAVMAVLAG